MQENRGNDETEKCNTKISKAQNLQIFDFATNNLLLDGMALLQKI